MPNIDYERINFQDIPANLTPLAARLLNRIDKTVYDITNYLNKSKEYLLNANDWGSSGDIIYPFIYIISDPGVYENSDTPMAEIWGTHEIETQEELDSIKYITKVIVDESGVKVYANSRVNVNLKLILKM